MTRPVDAAALPDAIEIVIVGIRAGLSPSRAVELAATHAPLPLRPAFGDVVHRLHRGHGLADALQALPEALGPRAAAFADTLATVERYGLPIEPALERLTTDVRTERRRQIEGWVRTLPVRLAVPLVVCTLPSFVLLAIVPAVMAAVSTLSGTAP